MELRWGPRAVTGVTVARAGAVARRGVARETGWHREVPLDTPLRSAWAWILAFGLANALAFALGWPFIVV